MADEQRIDDRMQEAYRLTFGSEHGQMVLRDLMAQHSFFTTTFRDTPHSTAFCEGERNVILNILNRLGRDLLPRDAVRESVQGWMDRNII